MEDPEKGPELLQRQIDQLETQVSELKAQLRDAKDAVTALEKEKHDRYNKFKAEVYENSMMLMREVQKGHNDALEAANKRISFLESELHAAQHDLLKLDQLEKDLEGKNLECAELQEALEEIEEEKQNEIDSAVLHARKHAEEEMKVRFVTGDSSSGALKAEQKHKNNLAKALQFVEQIDSDEDHQRSSRDEDGEDVAEQMENLSEENETLMHRVCDLEEKNKRLEREIHKLKDSDKRNLELEEELHKMHDNVADLEQRYNRTQMEQQIFLEMELRNRQWDGSENRDKNPKKGDARRSRSAGLSSKAGTSGGKEEIVDSHSSLFQQSDREFLLAQITARDTYIRGLKNCSHRRASSENQAPATQSVNSSQMQLMDSPAATDMSIYRKLKAAENEATRLREEVEGKQQQIEALISTLEKPNGIEKDLRNMLKQVAVVVPDHKRNIPVAVLEANDNNKAVFVRKGLYTWKDPINVDGCLRIMGEEGATLRGSWIMNSNSSGIFKGLKCESESKTCMQFEDGTWQLFDCTFRGLDRNGEPSEVIQARNFTDLAIQECHFQVDSPNEASCALMLDKSDTVIEKSSFNGTGLAAIVVKEMGRQELRKVSCAGFHHAVFMEGSPTVSLLDNCSLGSLKGAFSVASTTPQALLDLRKETYILGGYCKAEEESVLVQRLGGEDKSFWSSGGQLIQDRIQKRHWLLQAPRAEGETPVGSHRACRVEVPNHDDGEAWPEPVFLGVVSPGSFMAKLEANKASSQSRESRLGSDGSAKSLLSQQSTNEAEAEKAKSPLIREDKGEESDNSL